MAWLQWCAAWTVWLVGAAGLGFTAGLMPYAIDVTEPQLIFAQVIITTAVSFPFWLAGTAALLSLARRRRWVIALSALPWAVVAAWSVPTVVDVCGRPDGSCG